MRLGVFVLASGIASLLLLNFCHLLYQCGCRAPWDGGVESCNIHQPNVRHCPWCSYGFLTGQLPLACIVVTQAAVAFWPGSPGFWPRLVAALVAFPITGGLVGLAFGWISGYWS